uniref:Uncharacterized protein n=1 Tax=Arundo donax TaxID=35708 RepID=A0A0A9H7G8_ARUDO
MCTTAPGSSLSSLSQASPCPAWRLST